MDSTKGGVEQGRRGRTEGQVPKEQDQPYRTCAEPRWETKAAAWRQKVSGGAGETRRRARGGSEGDHGRPEPGKPSVSGGQYPLFGVRFTSAGLLCRFPWPVSEVRYLSRYPRDFLGQVPRGPGRDRDGMGLILGVPSGPDQGTPGGQRLSRIELRKMVGGRAAWGGRAGQGDRGRASEKGKDQLAMSPGHRDPQANRVGLPSGTGSRFRLGIVGHRLTGPGCHQKLPCGGWASRVGPDFRIESRSVAQRIGTQSATMF